MAEGQWYYCLIHQAVEPYAACRAQDRLGPYETRDDAQEALERLRLRNKQWDDEDRRWEGDESADDELGDEEPRS